MRVLIKKVIRDILKNKSQFITIFIMVFLAVYAFAGVRSYMNGMIDSSEKYYEDYNLPDLWITSKDVNDERLERIKHIDNVANAERLITINANVIGSEKYTNPVNNKPLTDLVIECNFIESNKINKMYLEDGEEFSVDKSGLWLDGYLAKNLGIKIGDEIELSLEGTSFKEKVLGLVEVPDHVYSIKDETSIFPTHSDFGFAYMSINEFPEMYLYNKIIDSDEIKDAVEDLKELRDTLKQYGITDYSNIPSMITEKIEDSDKIDLGKALDLLDNYDESDSTKEAFVKALDKDFNIKDSYVYPFAIVELKDDSKANETKKEIKKIEDVITVIDKEDNFSYSGFRREAEEGETYSGVFSGLFVFIAMLSVVTTMHRFVKKERIQIGTLKALGIRKSKITFMYVNYGFFVAVLASILGVILGVNTVGTYFLAEEMAYYEVPYYSVSVVPLVYYVAIGIVAVITFVTYLSCRKVLKEPAAEAIRIERPKVKVNTNGITTKKIFNKLSLSTKWNIRDIGRSKSRTLMALVGIAGCTMLVITALGMNDTLNAYIDWEFNTISNFDYKLTLVEDYTNSQYDKIIEKYGDNTSQSVAIEFKKDDEIIVKPLTVNNSNGMLAVTDHDRKTFTMNDDGLYITEKMASIYNMKIGDDVSWHVIGEDRWYNTKIVGFNRDPQAQQFNCTKAFWNTTSKEYKADCVYTNVDLSSTKEIEGVNTIQSIQNLKDGVFSLLGMMYALIALLIIVSAALAFVIIYNLGVLSFGEKEYQFATLKVLGFKYKTIKSIFIKQNIWISILAILIAFPLGTAMTEYIFVNAIGDTYDFNAIILPVTYAMSGLSIFVVSYLVNQFLARKIKKLDMVSSLKGNE